MTDDQGHNDTAVPPKTTSAKEAAPPTIGDNNKRNILNIYDIYVCRDSEKNTPEKYKTFWNICYGQTKNDLHVPKKKPS